MAQVKVTAQREIDAKPEDVAATLSDYRDARKQILTPEFSEYQVIEGGQGAGTVVSWKLQATKKRVRNCEFEVTAPNADTLVEKDRNSSMVTTWNVRQSNTGSTVQVETTWNGAGGIGGFFEKTFAPLGMRRIYDAELGKLAERLNRPS